MPSAPSGLMEWAIIFLPLAILFFFAAFSGTGRGSSQSSPGHRRVVAIVACVALGTIGLILVSMVLAAPGTPRLGGGGGRGALGMIVFLAVALLAVLALGGGVAMIINPRTRPWGIALVIVGPMVLLGLLLIAPFLAYRAVRVAHPVETRTIWQQPVESYQRPPAPIPLDEDVRSAVQREIEKVRANVAKTREEVQRVRDEIAQKSHARRSPAKGKDTPARRDKRKADVKRPAAEAAPSDDKKKETAAEPAPKSRRPGRDPAEDPDPATAPDPATVPDQAEASDQPAPPKDAAPASTPPVTDKPAESSASSDENPPTPSDENPPAESTAPVAAPPDWVDSREGKVGDEYRSAIIVGPYTTRLECDRELLPEVHRAVTDYIDIYLGPEAKRRVRLPDDYVLQRVVRETWETPRESTVGPMTQLHVLLAFDRKTNDLIKQKWHEAQVQERVWRAGLILGYVLMGMAAVYCVLKIDVVTQGRSRPNMLLAAAAVAMGVLGIAIFYGCPRDDDAGMICVFFGLPLLLGAVGLTWHPKTRRFGVAILAGLALASLGLLRFWNC